MSSESAVHVFGELKTGCGDLSEAVGQAKIYLIEVVLAKAVKQLEKLVEECPQEEQDEARKDQEKAQSVIQTQLAWLTSNKYGKTENECHPRLIALAKTKLQ